ncbi:MAG TPA: DUF4142 domain-containing protein [Bryobacteraceae bacterium]|nr:DUF4142 domain-containing protein [Bryobacteraceae bacterium]
MMRILLTGGTALLSGLLLAQVPGSPQTMSQPGQPGRPGSPTNPTMNPDVAGEPARTQAKVDDKKFVQDAAMGGMTAVELGKLAAEKGSSDAVKQFGQRMVDDHTKATEELKKLADAKSINIPGSLDSKHRSRVDKLSKLSGAQFDKAYIKDQLKDHEQDVRDFQTEAQKGNDVAVKEFAAKTLPTLQEHLNMAKGINKGKSTAATADADRSKQ